MMRVSRWSRLAAVLLVAVVVVAGPPLVGLAGDEGPGLADEDVGIGQRLPVHAVGRGTIARGEAAAQPTTPTPTPTPRPRPGLVRSDPVERVEGREECLACTVVAATPTPPGGVPPTLTPTPRQGPRVDDRVDDRPCLACEVVDQTPAVEDRIDDRTCLACEIVRGPEELRPGEHELTFKPVSMANPEVWGMRWAHGDSYVCNEPRGRDPVLPSSVGFRNIDTTADDCTIHWYYQLAFKFDFSALRGHSLLPIDAVLRYRETVYEERDPNGNWVPFVGFQNTCRPRLGRPSGPWNPPNVLRRGIPYVDAREQNQIGVFSGMVDYVGPMIPNPALEADGLILVGKSEDRNPDKAACMSQISDITLAFTYVIADR